MASDLSYYNLLRLPENASFQELKKAYYREAKACHPDRHQGSPAKTEAFKRLVHAFDVLSDPVQRQRYDQQRAFQRDLRAVGIDDLGYNDLAAGSKPVLDTVADDILEELVVGNDVPRGATLQTLIMRDLESTARFIRFREGKNRYFQRDYHGAFDCFRRASLDCPFNILYRYFLARTCRDLGMRSLAEQHFELCLQLGLSRNPPQRLERIHSELRKLRQRRHGLLRRLLDKLLPPPPPPTTPTDQQMIEEVSRSMTDLVREQAREQRKQLDRPKDDSKR